MGTLVASRTLALLLSLLALCLAIAAARLVTKWKTAPSATAAAPDQEVRPDVPDGLDNKKVSPEADRAMIVERANQGHVMYTVFKARKRSTPSPGTRWNSPSMRWRAIRR